MWWFQIFLCVWGLKLGVKGLGGVGVLEDIGVWGACVVLSGFCGGFLCRFAFGW